SAFRRAATATVPPAGEYFTALSRRTARFWRSLSPSASAASGSSGTSTTKLCTAGAPSCATATASVTRPPTSVGASDTRRAPVSRRATLRMASAVLVDREPHLLAAPDDRDEPVARRRLAGRLQVASEDLRRRVPEGLFLRDARDLLRGLVPEDDVPLAVDGDDPVGDVGEDREAPLLLERDPLIELRVRERSRGIPGQRE